MTDAVIEITPAPQVEVPKVSVTLQDVQILEDHVRVKLDGGMEKVISISDFRTILNTTIGQLEDERIDGFNLPSNVFYFAKSGTTIQLSCYYQARTAEIRYFDRKMQVLMPNIIISHTLRKTGEKSWQVSSSRYFCTDFSVARLQKAFINGTDPSKHIFLMPMSNTYREGNMCYGGNSMISRFSDNNLRGLDWYYQYMFESPFNDDLGIAAIGGSMSVKQWYEYLQKLAKDGSPFPYEKLSGFSPA